MHLLESVNNIFSSFFTFRYVQPPWGTYRIFTLVWSPQFVMCCARGSPTRTCSWGPHAHVRVGLARARILYTNTLPGRTTSQVIAFVLAFPMPEIAAGLSESILVSSIPFRITSSDQRLTVAPQSKTVLMLLSPIAHKSLYRYTAGPRVRSMTSAGWAGAFLDKNVCLHKVTHSGSSSSVHILPFTSILGSGCFTNRTGWACSATRDLVCGQSVKIVASLVSLLDDLFANCWAVVIIVSMD